MMSLIKGDFSYFASGPHLMENVSNVYMGKFCSVADSVLWDCGFGHSTKNISTFPFNKMFPECYHLSGHPISDGDIVVENSVWIGTRSIIKSGIKICNGAIVGANSVVTHDIKPYEIVAGSPAKHIRFIFSQDKIDILQKIQWWDFPIEIIKKIAPILMSEDIYKLEEIYNDLKSKKII